ncbi:MAG TPA: hypothetical protein PLX59_00250 [Candidatus Cloacimonadota bacterium]|nr:hypothetical protein [Candidatus Cloacimonadota bacterium]
MKRHKKFLILIALLLIINSAFFIAWYGFNLKGKIRNIAENEIGKALGGEATIGELNFSERQIIAKRFEFAAPDSSLKMKVGELRIRYNLLKVITSGFKIRNLLEKVDIISPIVSLRLRPRAEDEDKKPSKPFEIPDLLPYFKEISLSQGVFNLDMELDLKLMNEGRLKLVDSFEGLEINASNQKSTVFSLTGTSANQGRIVVSGELNKGRLMRAEADLNHYDPLIAYHPDIKGFSTDLSLRAEASQEQINGPYNLHVDLGLAGTRATLFDKYPVQIASLLLRGNESKVRADITGLNLNQSSLAGYLEITDLYKDMGIEGSLTLGSFDLAILEQGLSGTANADLLAGGTLKEPQLSLKVASNSVAYQQWELQDIAIRATLEDKKVQAELISGKWENQALEAEASFDISSLRLKGTLSSSAIQSFGHELLAYGSMTYDLDFNQGLPMGTLKLENIDFGYELLELAGLDGEIHLIPLKLDGQVPKYMVDAKLRSSEGYYVNVLGDIFSRQLMVDMDLLSLDLAQLYANDILQRFNPILSGAFRAYLDGDQIVVGSNFNLDLSGDFHYNSDLGLSGTYNLASGSASLNLTGSDGRFNEEEVNLQLTADYTGSEINVYSFRINDLISLSGTLDPRNSSGMSFDLAVMDLQRENITKLYPPLEELLPQFGSLSLRTAYNWQDSGKVDANLNLRDLLLEGLEPLSGQIRLQGPPQACLAEGKITSGSNVLGILSADVSIAQQTAVDARLRLSNLKLSSLLKESPVQASITGIVAASYTDFLRNIEQPNLMVDLQAKELELPGLELDQIDLVAQQQANLLVVDAISAVKEGLVDLRGSGALDYNFISNSYFEGNHTLNLNLRGELFNWLHKKVGYIVDASGNSVMQASLGVREEQFVVTSGSIQVNQGRLVLQDQPESINNINLAAHITDNRFFIERCSARMGEGELRVSNYFSEDEGNHFMAAMLDLGIFRLSIDDPGILVSVPMFTPTRSLSQLTLSGLDQNFATVMGPFDDMKIKANVLVSRATVTYPPNTDNLLRLIYSVRDAALRRNVEDPLPLPFSMDLLVRIKDNVSYVTYPANIRVNPGSFIHVIYDGQIWSVKEADFSSDSGTLDFFGTVFQVDNVNVAIMDAQDLMQIQGNLTRRAPDGTIINLSIDTDNDTSKAFLERLQLTLSSDNPQDRTISQILSRVRYENPPADPTLQERESNLSSDAINLLSGNINSAFISPILYPFENSVRRLLKLDAFSMDFGFIQNLVNEYSNNSDQMAEYTDMQQVSSDILQFSSAILLNNLSLSMSKYLFSRFYVDYKLTLQEATDLQQNSALLISHDTSLRMMLPWALRLSYNLNYDATGKGLSHGLMLYRSFRFRGL